MSFSIRSGWSFFLKNLALLTWIITLFFISGGSIVGIVIFSGSYLIFAICTSILASYKPEKKNKYIDIKRFTKKEILGLVIAFVVTSLLSLVFTLIEIRYPGSIVMLIFSGNFFMSFFSILFHRVAIYLYESSVYDRSESIKEYTFKYLNIITFGINYEVQKILARYPLILKIPISIIFFLFLLWQFFTVIGVYNIDQIVLFNNIKLSPPYFTGGDFPFRLMDKNFIDS